MQNYSRLFRQFSYRLTQKIYQAHNVMFLEYELIIIITAEINEFSFLNHHFFKTRYRKINEKIF